MVRRVFLLLHLISPTPSPTDHNSYPPPSLPFHLKLNALNSLLPCPIKAPPRVPQIQTKHRNAHHPMIISQLSSRENDETLTLLPE